MERRVPTHDELLQMRQAANQKMTEAAVQQITNEYQSNVQLAYESAAAGKYDDAGYHLREAKRLEAEAAPYVAAAHQAQQAQQQQQYTEAEQDLMRHYPDEIRRNWNTALTAANNLVASKRQADPEADLWAYRNSAEYVAGIAHACGILDGSGAESIEVRSPNEALQACQSKYGKVTADEYNSGVQKLVEMKKLGYYRPE
jgi:hypothetical protein